MHFNQEVYNELEKLVKDNIKAKYSKDISGNTVGDTKYKITLFGKTILEHSNPTENNNLCEQLKGVAIATITRVSVLDKTLGQLTLPDSVPDFENSVLLNKDFYQLIKQNDGRLFLKTGEATNLLEVFPLPNVDPDSVLKAYNKIDRSIIDFFRVLYNNKGETLNTSKLIEDISTETFIDTILYKEYNTLTPQEQDNYINHCLDNKLFSLLEHININD